MRTIQIAEETYKFLQSKAIPFEEQPDDTIRRLIGMKGNASESQSNAHISNNSNAAKGGVSNVEKPLTSQDSNQQTLREFYSNALGGSNSKQPGEEGNTSLIHQYSNESLEKGANSNKLLENRSNSNIASASNSNIGLDSKSNSKVELSPSNINRSLTNQSFIPAYDKYSNISNLGSVPKGKKKPKTSLPELVRDGLLKENERVYFQNYRGIKFPQYEVTIADGQLKWNGSRYSMSDLASKLLKDQDPTQDNDFVRGPVLWVNAAGKTMADLWDLYLAKKGV